ncbi:hypothetical protein D9Q98_009649 [Chlorella vulgaris]|uniref:Uncharacterized protein n=1 Tax=Chlorella vulgaris TaxID=3077 RepID=A0A9D4TES5_CHLVU|nr:hypothetical protein D9Q98_009649 [Chlorella vulgaris]
MAAALSTFVAPRPAAFTSQQQRRGGRRSQRCFAAVEEEKKALDFTSNKNSALGFTESDSAGQTNIFAVEPKTYVAGSSADGTSSGSQTTIAVASVAALGAAAAVVAGLVANSGPNDLSSLAPEEGLKSLSEYSQLFASQAPAAASAPSLVD